MEKDGETTVRRKHELIVGTWSATPSVRRWLQKGDVPQGGYCVRAWHQDGTNRVVIAGDRPVDVLYGVVDFVEDGIQKLRAPFGNGLRYRSLVFDGGPIRTYASRRVPQTKIRSLFIWGHVIDDYRQFFKEVARLRLNRVILWNDYPPVNAAEVVACAHSWGIEVYWGFAWGWDTDCEGAGSGDFDGMVGRVVSTWRRDWRDLPGDGIYFQTFTERKPGRLEGETVAERAIRLVNAVAGRIHAERPGLPIVFGLHATSVREEMRTVAKTDPTLEILWEDCGGFPYSTNFNDDPDGDLAFTHEIAGQGRVYGLAIKCQLLQDWGHWEHQSGPFLLGCAGSGVLAHDRRISDALTEDYEASCISVGLA